MKNGFFRLRPETQGLLYGLLGVAAFSLTLPATRLAVRELPPLLVGLGRAEVAGALAALLLLVRRQRRPARQHWPGLALVALGVVVGFPLLSAWAMQRVPAAHGAVLVGLLPLATAVAGVVRAGERLPGRFWLCSVLGTAVLFGFVLSSGGGSLRLADAGLLVAVAAAAIGYAEGGRLARQLGGWQTICWALVLAAPFLTVPVGLAVVGQNLLQASAVAWGGFAYVSVVSMFLAFFAWYHGLALGGIARVGQVQLLQPLLTIAASALLLGEAVSPAVLLTAALIIGTVALGRKAAPR